MANKFPAAVQITIETIHQGRDVSLSTVAAVHMTNNNLFGNEPTSASPTPTPAAGTTSGTTGTAGTTGTGTGTTGTGTTGTGTTTGH